MKNKSLLLVVFNLVIVSVSSAANYTARCLVTSDTTFPVLPKTAYLEVKYRTGGTHSYVDSLKYIYSDEESETEKNIVLYGGRQRGSYQVGYCNPDDHEFREYSQSFSFYSKCSGIAPYSKVNFRADLGIQKEGKVTVTAGSSDGQIEQRAILTAACELAN